MDKLLNNVVLKEVGSKIVLELVKKKYGVFYTSAIDLAEYVGINEEEVRKIISDNNGEINDIEPENNDMYVNNQEILFNSKETAMEALKTLKDEIKVSYVYNNVKKLEKRYNSSENKTRDDIKALYKDSYILSIWEFEKYTEETGEGFLTFEGFLIDYIEQNLIFE